MKRIIFFTICIVLLMVIANLSKSIYELYHKKDLLIATQKRLSAAEKENRLLKNQLTQVQDPSFIESQARDKLFLAKPGESVVLVPTQTPEKGIQSSGEKPNWQQWWELFFGQ